MLTASIKVRVLVACVLLHEPVTNFSRNPVFECFRSVERSIRKLWSMNEKCPRWQRVNDKTIKYDKFYFSLFRFFNAKDEGWKFWSTGRRIKTRIYSMRDVVGLFAFIWERQQHSFLAVLHQCCFQSLKYSENISKCYLLQFPCTFYIKRDS